MAIIGRLSTLRKQLAHVRAFDAALAHAEEIMTPGSAVGAVFFPEDAHRPCLADGQPGEVRKLVVKIPVY
jgi:hypothetical protein